MAGTGSGGSWQHAILQAFHETLNQLKVLSERKTYVTAAAHTGVSAGGAAVAITLAASSGKKHKIRRVCWSYSASPTGGGLTITDDGAAIFQIDIAAAGAGSIDLALESAVANKAMVLTLAAPGGAVVGKLNIPGAVTE